ncbi:MAG TPA: substrate-binding domain-containing protein [Anaerolineaceae bacterium]|nr:substrate-binding domain-containing protein [Anaerolineaceae bacterium]
MRKLWKLVTLVVLIAILVAGCAPTAPQSANSGNTGDVTHVGLIGGSDRAEQEYVWISQFSSLPLFVERVYPGLDAFARDYGVSVRKAGPTTVDLAAYIATVEQECARQPAGIIVVGGWDPALTEPVNKCIDMKVPVVVTDGDLFQSRRLSYVGTDWYQLGVRMAEYQIAEHQQRGLTSGEIAILSPIQNENMQRSRQGIKDTLEGTGIVVVAEEDNDSQADLAAQRVGALLNAFPNLTGLVGLDSESGPGIIAALDEAGRSGEGQIIVTTNESGREFLNNIKEGKVQMITMEKYDVMNYLALTMLYAWHNDAIRTGGIDPWTNNWMPRTVDSGLLLVTAENVDQVIEFMEEAAAAAE